MTKKVKRASTVASKENIETIVDNKNGGMLSENSPKVA